MTVGKVLWGGGLRGDDGGWVREYTGCIRYETVKIKFTL